MLVEVCGEIRNYLTTIFVETNIPFMDPKNKSEAVARFDSIIHQVIKICEKYGTTLGSEEEQNKLWLFSIKQIFQVKEKVYKEFQEGFDTDIECMNFERFLQVRNQYFMQKMSDQINLRVIIQFL